MLFKSPSLLNATQHNETQRQNANAAYLCRSRRTNSTQPISNPPTLPNSALPSSLNNTPLLYTSLAAVRGSSNVRPLGPAFWNPSSREKMRSPRRKVSLTTPLRTLFS